MLVINDHNITPYFSMKMYNATKHAVSVLCEGLRHELQLVGSKIKVSVCIIFKRTETCFTAVCHMHAFLDLRYLSYTVGVNEL